MSIQTTIPNVSWLNNAARAAYVLLALALVSFPLGCGGKPAKMSAAQSADYEALREMGALIVKDGEHPATVTMSVKHTPQVAQKLDEAIQHVSNLPYVTHLEVTGLAVTDEHMQSIKKLRELNSLVISQTQVGDEGLKAVSGLPIDALYVDESKLTGAAMATLAKMSKLKILDISGLDVSDISSLTALPDLEWLILDKSTVSTEAVDTLVKMPALARLSINGSTIADDDLEKLKKAMPSLKIDGPGSAEENTEAQPGELTQ